MLQDARILKVYIEALTGFSHIFNPDSLNNTLLSQGCILGVSPTVGMVGGMCIPRAGEQEMSPIIGGQFEGQLKDLLQPSTPCDRLLQCLPALLQCALSGQQGVSLAWRWLVFGGYVAVLEADDTARVYAHPGENRVRQ